MTREGQGKNKEISRQGQGKGKQNKHNLKRNYNLMNFGILEIYLVY